MIFYFGLFVVIFTMGSFLYLLLMTRKEIKEIDTM